MRNGIAEGNPAWCDSITRAVANWRVDQAAAGTHHRTSAAQMTHVHLLLFNEYYFDQFGKLVAQGINVQGRAGFNFFVVAILLTICFATGLRMGDLLHALMTEVSFGSWDALLGPIRITIHNHKCVRARGEPINRLIHPNVVKDICGVEKLMTWLDLMNICGIHSGPLFPRISSHGRFLRHGPDMKLTVDAVSTMLADMCKDLEMEAVFAVHGPRRGYAGFQHFVMMRSVTSILREHCAHWLHKAQCENYVGIVDKTNAYEDLGFAADLNR